MTKALPYKDDSSRLKAQSSIKFRFRPALLSAFNPAGAGLFAVLSDSTVDPSGEKGFGGQTSSRPLRIAIAGGGTGGHLFPGIAIAQEFMARNSDTKVIFISTGNPLERSVLSKANFKLETIKATELKAGEYGTKLNPQPEFRQEFGEPFGFLKIFPRI